jgi:hypothetical protein
MLEHSGLTSRLSPPQTPTPAPVAELDPATSDLVARHGTRAVMAAAATALLAARERDRFDAFEASTFGVDRSTPTPLDLPAAAPAASPTDDAFDAFERATFDLPR